MRSVMLIIMMLLMLGSTTLAVDWTPQGNINLRGWYSMIQAIDVNATGEMNAATLNTGQGDYELYAMNQDVESTDAVVFASVDTGQGANELYDMDQNVLTTSPVVFLTVDTGQGANELYDMDQNVLTTSTVTFDDVIVTGLTNGSILFVTDDGKIAQDNSALFWDATDKKLAIGSNAKMRNFFQAVTDDAATDVDATHAVMSLRNIDLTNDNLGIFSFQTYDDAGSTVTSGARLITKFTSHTDNAVSADFSIETTHAGTKAQRLWIKSDGDVGISTANPATKLDVNGTITATALDVTTYNLVEDDIPTLSSTWDNTMDADRLTGLDFLNNQITITGDNITAGTVSGSYIEDVFVHTAGDTMSGDLVMDSNSITGVLDLNATGEGNFATVNTGQGAYELFAMNQDVESTDAVTFASVDTGQGANDLFDMDQNVLTTSAVTFDTLSANQTWVHQSYPAACPGSGAIIQLGDAVTCADLWVDVAGDTMTGNLNFDNNLEITMDNTTGTARNILTVDASNNLLIGRETSGSNFAFLPSGGHFYLWDDTINEFVFRVTQSSRLFDMGQDVSGRESSLVIHGTDSQGLEVRAADTSTDAVKIYHDDTDGHITTNAGDLKLTPNGADVLITGGTTITQAGALTGLSIDQNGNAKALYIDSEATTSNAIRLDGENTEGYMVLFDNDGAMTGGGAVTAIWQDHASSDQPALMAYNDGTGHAILVDQNGNGISLNIDTEATSADVINIDANGNITLLDLNKVGAGTGVGDVINVENDGTGNGIFVNQDGDGYGIYIDSEATTSTKYGMLIRSAGGHGSIGVIQEAAATGLFLDQNGAGTALDIDQDGAGTAMTLNVGGTGQVGFALTQTTNWDGLVITNSGVGNGQLIDQNGNGIALKIDSEATTVAGIDIAMVDANKVGVNTNGYVLSANTFNQSYIYIHTNSTIPIASAGVWYNVTYEQLAASEKYGIDHTYNDATNDTFTIETAGKYQIYWHVSFEDSAASPSAHVATRLIKNGVEVCGSVFERDTTKQNAHVGIHHGGIATFAVNDVIKVQFIASATTVSLETQSTYGDCPSSASIMITRID